MEQVEPTFSPELSVELDRLGLEFLADILAIERTRHPSNLEALAELGHVYTRLGRYTQGLEVDRALAARCPLNPTAHYNLACSLALLGRKPEALDSLEQAAALGYDDPEQMRADDDLESLRGEHRFLELVRRLEEAARDR